METKFYVMGGPTKGQIIADFFNLRGCSNTQDISEYDNPYNLFFVDADNYIVMAYRLDSTDTRLFDFIRDNFPENTVEDMLTFISRK